MHTTRDICFQPTWTMDRSKFSKCQLGMTSTSNPLRTSSGCTMGGESPIPVPASRAREAGHPFETRRRGAVGPAAAARVTLRPLVLRFLRPTDWAMLRQALHVTFAAGER